jgi:hypothetical protein
MVYDVKIESADGEIVFDQTTESEGTAINKVVFKMNTLNDETLNRADAVRCELFMEGVINKATKDETLKLTKWSMEAESENLMYRKVTVTAYKGSNRETVLRQYCVDQMFCIDYDEVFGEINAKNNDEQGKFILHIAQKEGNHSKDVFAI